MKKYIHLNLRVRISIQITLFLMIFVSVFDTFYFSLQKQKTIENVENQMFMELNNLVRLVDIRLKENKKNLQTAQKIAYSIINFAKVKERLDTSQLKVDVVNPQSTEDLKANIRVWELNKQPIYNHFEMVDSIQQITQAVVGIFQKFSLGYLCISTNILDERGNRMVNTYIANATEIAKNIENGETFTTRAFVINTWYLMTYRPIYIDGIIKGILAIGLKENVNLELKIVFENKKYLKSGYPYVVDKNGYLIVHPKLENESVSTTSFFKGMSTKKNGLQTDRYFWPEDETGKWKYSHYIYHPPIESFIAVSYYEDELFEIINEIRSNIIFVTLFLMILLFFISWFSLRDISLRMKKLRKILNSISNGEDFEKIEVKKHDEVGEMMLLSYKISENLHQAANFSDEIRHGNLDKELKLLSQKDVLGTSLLKMRNTLLKTRNEEDKRKYEDNIRNWKTEGVAKFSEILRIYSEKEDFFYQILLFIIHYVDVNQGGLFVIEENRDKEKFLEMVSCHAYNQRKLIENKIEYGVGLLWRGVIEKRTIYLTEIPADYISITSGLGEALPKSILIVPVKMHEEIFGVLELASFNEFPNHHIEFLEEVGKNIASAISTSKINRNTKDLLQQFSQQTKKMNQQEAEMVENLQELEELQRDVSRKESELDGILKALHSGTLVVELNAKGVILNINSKFLEIMNLKKDDVVGENYSDFTSLSVDSDEYKAMWDRLQHGLSVHLIEKISLENGKHFWVSETFSPIIGGDGKLIKVLNIAVDISESKELEKKLNEQQNEILHQKELIQQSAKSIKNFRAKLEEKESLFETTTSIIDTLFLRIECDSDGKILDTNLRFLELTGYSKIDLENRDFRELLARGEFSKFETAHARTLDGNIFEGKIDMRTADKKIISLRITEAPVRDRDDKISKILIIAQTL